MKQALAATLAPLALLLLLGRQPDAAAGPAPTQPAATPEVVDALPLDFGYYVRTDEPCDDATSAGVHLVNRAGMRWVTSFCLYERIERTGANRYRVHQRCGDHGGTGLEVADYEIPDRTSFSFRSDSGWEHAARLCPQREMPEPWRSEDISDQVR